MFLCNRSILFYSIIILHFLISLFLWFFCITHISFFQQILGLLLWMLIGHVYIGYIIFQLFFTKEWVSTLTKCNRRRLLCRVEICPVHPLLLPHPIWPRYALLIFKALLINHKWFKIFVYILFSVQLFSLLLFFFFLIISERLSSRILYTVLGLLRYLMVLGNDDQ